MDLLGLAAGDPRREPVRILNPLSEDLSVMRTSLIPGLLDTARYNLSWKNENLKLFELKRIFLSRKGERLPEEKKYLTGLATGLDQEPHWSAASKPIDVYDLKGCVEDILEALHVQGVGFVQAEDIPYLHPGRAARIVHDKEMFGVLGEIHPEVLTRYEMGQKAFLFEIDFDRMLDWVEEDRRFKPLSKFPVVYRDLSLVVEEALEVGKVVEAIWNLRQPFIDEVRFFDLYREAPIPEGKKGLTYRIRYQSNDRTLTDEEVNRYHEKVISHVREAFQAELRGS